MSKLIGGDTVSLQPLVGWWPDRSLQTNKPRLSRRSFKRSFKRQRRRLVNHLRSQYYLSHAATDGYRAFLQNEDIAWACLLLLFGLSFGAISVVANVVYNFTLAASVMSTLSGFNLALLAVIALVVVAVLGLWLAAFLQNMWTIALYEGATRKQKKSLRLTVRRALQASTRTATAWVWLAAAALVPAAILNAVVLLIVLLAHLKLASGWPLIAGAELVALGWIGWVLANFGLLPQVALIEAPANWHKAAAQARQLVANKGRVFNVSAYLVVSAGLAIVYVVALGVQAITHTASTLTFLLFSIVPASALNGVLTMLYRKRRLARS